MLETTFSLQNVFREINAAEVQLHSISGWQWIVLNTQMFYFRHFLQVTCYLCILQATAKRSNIVVPLQMCYKLGNTALKLYAPFKGMTLERRPFKSLYNFLKSKLNWLQAPKSTREWAPALPAQKICGELIY